MDWQIGNYAFWCSGGPPVYRRGLKELRPSPAASRVGGSNAEVDSPTLRKGRSMKVHEKKRMKIAFFGHFDTTNFVNESILQAILHHLRYYQPDAAVTCISTGPEATSATHQIEAIPISENLLFKFWLPRNPLLRLVRRVFIGIP